MVQINASNHYARDHQYILPLKSYGTSTSTDRTSYMTFKTSSVTLYCQGTMEKFFVPGGFAVGHKDLEIAVIVSYYLCTATEECIAPRRVFSSITILG